MFTFIYFIMYFITLFIYLSYNCVGFLLTKTIAILLFVPTVSKDLIIIMMTMLGAITRYNIFPSTVHTFLNLKVSRVERSHGLGHSQTFLI